MNREDKDMRRHMAGKRLAAMGLVGCLALGSLTGCSGGGSASTDTKATDEKADAGEGGSEAKDGADVHAPAS